MSNIEKGSQKAGEIIGYGAAAGVKAIGVALSGLGRGLKKGANDGIASSPSIPEGPISAVGQAVGSTLGAARRAFREAQARTRQERDTREFGWEQREERA